MKKVTNILVTWAVAFAVVFLTQWVAHAFSSSTFHTVKEFSYVDPGTPVPIDYWNTGGSKHYIHSEHCIDARSF